MSALWAGDADSPAAPRATPAGRQGRSRPILRGLPQLAPRLARVPFIGVLIALFALGMTGLLMLNTTLQYQAFQVSTLHRQASELAYGQSDLEGRLDQLAAPQELARRASAAGLRPNPYPAFLVLPKGNVLGQPRRVTGGEMPALIVKTPEQLAAERVRADARRQALAAQQAADAQAKAQRARDRAVQPAPTAAPSVGPTASAKPTARTNARPPAASSTPKPSGGHG